jgi:hypothetical protein
MFNKMSSIPDFSRLSTLKHFTGSIVSEAITALNSGKIKCDIHTDFYTRSELTEKLNDIVNCGSLLELREYDGKEQVIHNANFCKNPIACSCCADRVSRRRQAIWKPRIKEAVKRFQYVYFMTMTIKDGFNLENRIETLVESKKRFRLMGQRRGIKYSNGQWSRVGAAISNTEIKYGSGNNGAHVHEHALLFCDDILDYSIYDRDKLKALEAKFGRGSVPESIIGSAVKYWYFSAGSEPVPVSSLSWEWVQATGGEGINIDVKPLSYSDYLKNPYYKGFYCASFSDWITNQASEILKYNSKLSEDHLKNPVTPEQYIELIQRRGSRRLFNSYGAFRRRGDPLYFSSEDQSWLEYVEKRDEKQYTIKAGKYNGSTWDISGPIGAPLFQNSDAPDRCKRRRLSEQGRIVGRYRRTRSAILFNRKRIPIHLLDLWRRDAESEITRIRAEMKIELRTLWKTNSGFEDENDYEN